MTKVDREQITFEGNKEQLNILLDAIANEDIGEWNKWKENNPEVEINLKNVNLKGVSLIGANFEKANLIKADFKRADLSKAKLNEANLKGADMKEVVLEKAELNKADLIATYLRSADLKCTHLKNAYLDGSNLREADLAEADLTGASLLQCTFLKTNIEKTKLSGCYVYGISVWDIQGTPADQNILIITPNNVPQITVDNIKVAQFIYLILNNKEIRDVINTITQKGVLLLGRFSDGGYDLLQSIANKLREDDYLPIIFDFDRPKPRDFTETINVLAGMSRFVIADLSGPSVPMELHSIINTYEIPFVFIIERGKKPFSLAKDFLAKNNVVKKIVEYKSGNDLQKMIPSRIIQPAEKLFKKRQNDLDKIFKK